jgi:hypothetical protein
MAEICPVCNEKIYLGELWSTHEVDGSEIHDKDCILKYRENPEKYGGKAREPDNESIERLQKTKEIQQKIEEKIEDKSVYVKGFRMPFGEMVTFIFKWTMASIPTAIFLAILLAIFTAIFA